MADFLLQCMTEHRPHCVGELGSGLWTLVLAAALKDIPGATLTSVEQDYDQTLKAVTRSGAAGTLPPRFYLRPLAPDGWYEDFQPLRQFDLLLADGLARRRCPNLRPRVSSQRMPAGGSASLFGGLDAARKLNRP